MRALVLAAMLAAAAPAAIAAGNDWHPSPAAAARLDRTKLDDMERAIAAGTYPKTTSVVIVLNGELAYELYAGDGGPGKPNDTRSATKSLTALAMGVAIAERKIPSVDAPAFAYLKDMAPFANDGPLKRQITIADLLTMSSALDCDDNNDTPGNEENMYPQQVWTRFAVDLPTKPGWRRDASGRGPGPIARRARFCSVRSSSARPANRSTSSSNPVCLIRSASARAIGTAHPPAK